MRRHFLTACVLAMALSAPFSARASGVDPDAATPVQREQAQARFGRARQLFVEKKFREALVEFQGSHDIVASPNARLYIAHCHRELGELVAAYEEFGRAATEAREHAVGDPRYTKTAESAEKERDAIAPKLGFVTLSVANATPETKLTVAGEEIRSAAWGEAAPVLPGTTQIVAETPGRPPTKVNVTLAVGEKKHVDIDAGTAPPPEPAPVVVVAPPPVEGNPRQGLRTASFVAAGVGVVGLAGFAVFGLMAKSTYDNLQSECHGPCATDHSDQVSSGKTQQTVADLALAVGVVGAVAGVTLFVVSRPPKSAEKSADAPAAAFLAGPGWLGVRGSF
jgi:hypothetical protein